MYKYFASLAALTLLGAATIALPADAAGRQGGATAARQGHQAGARNFGNARRHVAPRYSNRAYGNRGYSNRGFNRGYGNRGYGYNAYGYNSDPYGYGYYAPPLVSFGVGPFGLRLF